MAADVASVLIVDDSLDKLVALESILRDLNARIVTARSGTEALRRLLREDFAVVLLDVRMPGLDGFETAAMIRRRPRSEHTPIIFITAYADETHVARGYSLKAVDYIHTPVVPEVLRTKVAVFVDLYSMTAEATRQAACVARRAEQLHRLAVTSLAINTAPSIDRVVEVAADSAREILGVERARVIANIDPRRVHRGVSTAPGASAPPDLEAPVAAFFGRGNGAYRSARRLAAGPDDTGVGRVETLGAPLAGRNGRTLGVIELCGKMDGGFTQEDEDLLVQLAQTTAVAIENTLYGEEREVNRLKDEFLATVSHELRTPLNAMLSWTWMLRRGSLDAERRARALEAIERNGRAQVRIVDDLLDLSRVVSGKLKLTARLVSLAPIVQEVAESALANARAKGVEVATVIDPEAATVVGDPDRLQQILSNLVSNALKFTPRGGHVELRVARNENEVSVCVADTGQGIAAEFLPYIFEPFRQADSSAGRRAGGLGLGLTIVRHLVALHGGRVEAASDGVGLGATFTVSLPRADSYEAPAARPPVPPELRLPTDIAVSLAGLHLLVVEDEPDTREAVGLILAQAGASVVAVGTAHEALAAVTTERPDALLCDIGLPGEDGYALMERLRCLDGKAGGNTPAVALTAYAYDSDRARALAAGFQAHVAKPIDPASLVQVVAEVAAQGEHATAPLRGAASESSHAEGTVLASSERSS